MSVDHLKVNSTEAYDVQTSVFLPTFILVTDNSPNLDGTDQVANDRNLFEFKFIDWETRQEIGAIYCTDLIKKMNLESEEKNSFLAQLASEYMLCPNIPSFKIIGNFLTEKGLQLKVTALEGANLTKVYNTQLYMAEITRDFNVTEYLQQGYQDFITLSETFLYPLKDKTIEVDKSIAREFIQFFTFKFIDTSAIPLLGLG